MLKGPVGKIYFLHNFYILFYSKVIAKCLLFDVCVRQVRLKVIGSQLLGGKGYGTS